MVTKILPIIKISLNATAGINYGRYRVGIWVNSNEAFDEDCSDNATLFKTPIEITTSSSGTASSDDTSTPQKEAKDNDGC